MNETKKKMLEFPILLKNFAGKQTIIELQHEVTNLATTVSDLQDVKLKANDVDQKLGILSKDLQSQTEKIIHSHKKLEKIQEEHRQTIRNQSTKLKNLQNNLKDFYNTSVESEAEEKNIKVNSEEIKNLNEKIEVLGVIKIENLKLQNELTVRRLMQTITEKEQQLHCDKSNLQEQIATLESLQEEKRNKFKLNFEMMKKSLQLERDVKEASLVAEIEQLQKKLQHFESHQQEKQRNFELQKQALVSQLKSDQNAERKRLTEVNFYLETKIRSFEQQYEKEKQNRRLLKKSIESKVKAELKERDKVA